MTDIQTQIESLWARRDELSVADVDAKKVVDEAIDLLDTGAARVAEPTGNGEVVVNEWLKLAILLLFRLSEMATVELGPFEFADKIPLKSDCRESRPRAWG